MNFDKKLLFLLKKAKIPFILTISLGIMVSLATISSTKLLAIIVNSVFLEKKILQQVLNLILLFAIVASAKSILMWLKTYFSFKISENIKNHLREILSSALFDKGPSNLSNEKSGEISNILTEGINKLEAYFSSYLPQVLFSTIIPILIIAFVFPIDWISGLVLFVTAPLIPLFMILIGKRAENLSKRQWKTLNFLSSHFFDVMQGLTTLKLFGKSKFQTKKISEISEEFRQTTIGVLKVAFLSALALELLSTISIAMVAVEIGIRLIFDKVEFVDGFFVLLIAPEFYLPLRQLGSSFHAGIDGVTASKSIFAVLDENTKNINGNVVCNWDEDFTIEMRNLSFSYDGKTNVIDNLNIKINSGSKIAIVGESGAGKSTFFNLLLKFIYPNSGEILFNNQKISDLTKQSWYSGITYLSQKPYLFYRTIEENLKISNENATEQEIRQAIEFANLTEFVNSLPNGINTIIGEKGINLSSGQIQRIAIARAFLKKSRLILLDEPTANLDAEIEDELQSKINKLSENKTVITIAHRLNTVISADFIFVFEKGKIVETGTHQFLLQQKGKYFEYFSNYRGEL